MSRVTGRPISVDTTVAEALANSPDAARLFERHGVDPRAECGMFTRLLTLDEAAMKCGLRDVERLVEELNTARKKATRRAWSRGPSWPRSAGVSRRMTDRAAAASPCCSATGSPRPAPEGGPARLRHAGLKAEVADDPGASSSRSIEGTTTRSWASPPDGRSAAAVIEVDADELALVRCGLNRLLDDPIVGDELERAVFALEARLSDAAGRGSR